MLLVILICFDDRGGRIGWCGVPCPMWHAQSFPRLPGECSWRITRATVMVIDVACGPMAYKTQLLAYTTYVENQLLFFAMERTRVTLMISMKNVQYSMWRSYTIVLRFSSTKSNMLYTLQLSYCGGVISDELLDTLAGAWAGGAGSGRYFLQPNKFSVCCVLCHIAPVCHFLLCFVS